MKKSLILLSLLISYISYSQNDKWDKGVENVFVYGGKTISKTYSKLFIKNRIFDKNVGFTFGGSKSTLYLEGRIFKGGVGVEIYGTYDDIERTGFGVYYVTPSIYGFDLSIGGGSISDRKPTKVNWHFDYLGNWTNISSLPFKTYGYGLISLNKDVHLYKSLKLQLKYTCRLHSGNTNNEIGAGLSFSMRNRDNK